MSILCDKAALQQNQSMTNEVAVRLIFKPAVNVIPLVCHHWAINKVKFNELIWLQSKYRNSPMGSKFDGAQIKKLSITDYNKASRA